MLTFAKKKHLKSTAEVDGNLDEDEVKRFIKVIIIYPEGNMNVPNFMEIQPIVVERFHS